jgi:hypothetical protein
MKKIICKHCGKTIEVKHGNTKYCEPCKKIAIDQTSSNRYARISLEADPYWLNEKILRTYYGKDMDPDFLESEGFDFEKYREQININGETVFAMKKFAFSILKNKTVRIWTHW